MCRGVAERNDPSLESTDPFHEISQQGRDLLRCKVRERLPLRLTMAQAIPNSGQYFDTNSAHHESRIF
jgi:hypothetical protein